MHKIIGIQVIRMRLYHRESAGVKQSRLLPDGVEKTPRFAYNGGRWRRSLIRRIALLALSLRPSERVGVAHMQTHVSCLAVESGPDLWYDIGVHSDKEGLCVRQEDYCGKQPG